MWVKVGMTDAERHIYIFLAKFPSICGSVVLATNETAEDLQWADDLEMIHEVQQAMGIS